MTTKLKLEKKPSQESPPETTVGIGVTNSPAAGTGPEKPQEYPRWLAKFLRRRQFWINPALQFQLLANTATALLLFSSVMTITIFFPLVYELQSYDNVVGNQNSAVAPLLYLHDNFWSLSILTILAVVCLAIHSSHKVAGPLYRFKQVFRHVRDGNISDRVRLRKGDFLGREEVELNQMLIGLRTKIATVKKAEEALRREIARVQVAAIRDENPKLTELVQEFADLEGQLEQSLQHFELGADHV